MLEDRIYQDYIESLKTKDKFKVDFLSFLRAQLKNLSKDLKKEKLDDKEVFKVLQKQKKRLQELKNQLVSSERKEALKEIEQELNIIQAYLPEPLTQEELSEIVNEAIRQTNATSLKDMGRVMREVLSKVGPRVQPQEVSNLVKERLSSR